MTKDSVSPSDFVNGYLTTALWAETLDSQYSLSDIEPESVAKATEVCLRFVHANTLDLREYVLRMRDSPDYPAWGRAGHDFWLTRNGHGTGFWDRGLGELGDRLAAAAKAYKEASLYVGDDGKLHHS